MVWLLARDVRHLTSSLSDCIQQHTRRLRTAHRQLLIDDEERHTLDPRRARSLGCPGNIVQKIDIVQPARVHTELLPGQIIDLQLIEELYWQEEDGLLYTRLVAVAPRFKFYYQEGQWYPRIGFYRRCDE